MILNLSKKISVWVERGLISSDQGAAILEAEGKHLSRSWVLFGVAFIGVTTILTGLVSLIAANWGAIPSNLKLFSYFGLQAIVGFIVLKWDCRPGPVREGAILFFALFFFAGIGLIAQVFNLHSSPWRGQLLWLAMVLPITLFSRSFLLNHLWVIVALVTGGMWASDEVSSYKDSEFRVCVFVAFTVLLSAVGFLFEAFAGQRSRYFKDATIFWGLVLPLSVGSIIGDLLWMEHGIKGSPPKIDWLIIPWGAVILTAGLNYTRHHLNRTQRHLVAFLLIFTAFFVSFPLVQPWLSGVDALLMKIIGASGFVLIWALAAASAAYAHYQRFFDIASFMIAARFVVIYFQVFGTLTTTGLGLIISGMVILGAAYLWSRYRRTVLVGLGKEIKP